MAQQKTILVLGASFSGLASAHYLLRHVVPALPNKGEGYNVTLVNPSAKWFTRPAAPRAVVSDSLLPDSKTFHDIDDAFKKTYPSANFTFVVGKATSTDTNARTVTVKTLAGGEETIHYYALIIATGTRTFSPILGLTEDEAELRAALDAFRKQLPNAKNIVIAGGGPAGVETAGEIGDFLNGSAGFFGSRPAHPKAKITVVSSAEKLLPVLRPALAFQAEKLLNRIGVDVLYNTKVERTSPSDAGLTAASIARGGPVSVTLSDGQTIEADIYIPAYGVTPNTEFLPSALVDAKTKRVLSNKSTMRVDAAGPRVYVIGDVGDYSRGGVMDIYDAVPILMTNVKRDLVAAAGEDPNGKPAGADRLYEEDERETHLVPIGRGKGVGAVYGWKLPSVAVWAIKGRDYFASMAPAQVDGSKWAKESKWKPEIVS